MAMSRTMAMIENICMRLKQRVLPQQENENGQLEVSSAIQNVGGALRAATSPA
jgi:hypothetical protein